MKTLNSDEKESRLKKVKKKAAVTRDNYREHSRKLRPKHGQHKRLQEIAGIVALLGSLYIIISLATYDQWDRSLFTFSVIPTKNYGGIVGASIADVFLSTIGLAGYLIPPFLIIYGIRRIFAKERNAVHFIGVVLFLVSSSILLSLLSAMLPFTADQAGGAAGSMLSGFLVSLVSRVGTCLVGITILIVSVILMSPISIFSLITSLKKKPASIQREIPIPEEKEILITPVAVSVEATEFTEDTETPPDGFPLIESMVLSANDDYTLPPLELLKETSGVPGPPKEEITAAASGLEKKLLDFGIDGRVKQAHPGPVVTMYEFEPAPGVKINRIVSLSDDLALSLRAPSIRVYPIAGKATIGIEVPNRLRASVSLKEIIASEIFQKSPSPLTVALGKDIFGIPVVTDLIKMPHLLVAGATGSGKSVSINVMIMSILYKAAPDEVKMLLIDPKLLELSAYTDIPHLISPVITSPKDASDALKKMVFEMERRYRLIAEKGTRNIETYNRQVPRTERLPYIVVFIDELADLMFTAPSDVEDAIARLAQMARASGIHLIIATQRPSVDVITGLIKANFPARISFQVTSKIDSRTILDAQGAEQLLGMGDMLFMVPGVKIIRIHGAYISETEVKEITEFIKHQGSPEYASFENIVVLDEKERGMDVSSERDEMYQRVIDFAESVGEVSISSIQRRFKIGYNRAARIMELLEDDGLVGPPKGAGKPRDFLGGR